MKKQYLYLIASAFFIIISCSDDDSNNGIVSVTPDPAEEIALDPADVSENIMITNGTKKSGNAPAPNSTIPFSLDKTTQSGFQKNGFDITFQAPTNYAGAYIQIQSGDGTTADQYWDVSGFVKSTKTKKRKGILNQATTTTTKMNDQEVEIDVDFGDDISAGTFCYLICIYDNDGNISEPVEACVEVESWGGNPNLVGVWNYTKLTENGITILPGEESSCYESSVYCNNDEIITYNSCFIINAFKLQINNDGTYEYRTDDTDKDINYEQSEESCTIVYEDDNDEYYVSKGKWSYNEEENRMTLIEFEYIDAYDDQVNEGVEENGYLDFDGETIVNSSTLVIKFSYNDDNKTFNYEYFFDKE